MKYKTISKCRGRGRKEILKRLQAIFDRHTKRDFPLNGYHAENYFKNIEADIVPYNLNTQTVGEYETKLERNIRTLKDRTVSTVR